jgi:cytochrome c oxidase subunit 2
MNEFLRRLLALPEQASTVARDVDGLHYFVILVTLGGSALVGLAALYFLIRYRRRPGDGLTPHVETPVWLEVTWVTILLGLFVTWWLIGYRIYLRIQTPPPGSMDVFVTAQQWMWKFSYPNGNSSISTLVVPIDRPVRLNMTSRDVIHSFSVPDFRIKQDVLPGRYTVIWFEAKKPGVHQILCAEYCGVSHSNMWGSVVVLSGQDYETWLEGGEPDALGAGSRLTAAERPEGRIFGRAPLERGIAAGENRALPLIGREVAVRHACLACHTLDGRRHIGPTFLGLYRSVVPLEGGQSVIADEAYLTESMMEPNLKIVRGFLPQMPSYQGRLSGPEAGALVELIKSLAGGEPVGGKP